MRQITHIEIGFENCESTEKLTVPSSDAFSDKADVAFIALPDIKRNLGTIAMNATAETYSCKKCKLVLNPKADKRVGGDGMFWGDKKKSLFDRIAMNDIVLVELYFEDNTSMIVYMPWGGESEYSNDWQKTKRTKDGKLKITIKERKRR